MSRFNYKHNEILKRTELISVLTEEFTSIMEDKDLNRVQRILAIRQAVRDSYITQGYRHVEARFVDGVINDVIETGKLEGSPIPEVLFFNVELEMPIVDVTNVPVGLKSETAGGVRDYNYKPHTSNDHKYWS